MTCVMCGLWLPSYRLSRHTASPAVNEHYDQDGYRTRCPSYPLEQTPDTVHLKEL